MILRCPSCYTIPMTKDKINHAYVAELAYHNMLSVAFHMPIGLTFVIYHNSPRKQIHVCYIYVLYRRFEDRQGSISTITIYYNWRIRWKVANKMYFIQHILSVHKLVHKLGLLWAPDECSLRTFHLQQEH